MSSRRDATAHRPLSPFTIDHFRRYAGLMVFDDGERRGLEDWQLEPVEDLFSGFQRNLWILPEGNGKTTLVALVALYGADYSISPWIPIGAAAAKQARILHDQAGGFVQRTPGMKDRFRVYGGYLRIESLANGGTGIEVFGHDPKTGDGVIPFPYGICDELHRHPDMRLWDLWGGKLRKRGAQLLGITTAGEPETPFENMRDKVRLRATDKRREGSHLRAAGANEILHEWMVPSDELCSDMGAVKAANPLSTITVETLRQDFEMVTQLGDWKRLKCNRPTRAVETAITDKEWDDAQVEAEIPAGAEVFVGIDEARKWDTTAMVALWKGPEYWLLGRCKVLVPPRDGSSLHSDDIKNAFLEVIDHEHRKTQTHVNDFLAFMNGIREGTVKHNGDPHLRAHALNAIARRLPGGDYRFDRPNLSRGSAQQQDTRVIDALSAAAMVVEFSTRCTPTRSVYEERFATA